MLILHEKSGLIIFLSEKQLFLITSPESHVWTGPSLKGSHRQMDLECRGFRPPKRLPRSLVQTYLTFKKETFWWICNWDVAINPPHKSVFFNMHSEKQKFSNLQSTTHLPGPRPDPDGELSAWTAESAWLCLQSVNTPRIHPAEQKDGPGTPRTITRTSKNLEIWE